MNVTASPVTWEVAGREVVLSPLTDRGIEEVSLWVRSMFIRSVRMSLEGEAQGVCDHQMRLAFRASLEIDWVKPPGSRQVLTIDGRAKLLQISARKNQPTMTHENARELLYVDGEPSGEALETFWDIFVLLNDLGDVPQEVPQGRGSLTTWEDSKAEFYNQAFEAHGLTPEELSDLTPAQLDAMLTKTKFATVAEYNNYKGRR